MLRTLQLLTEKVCAFAALWSALLLGSPAAMIGARKDRPLGADAEQPDLRTFAGEIEREPGSGIPACYPPISSGFASATSRERAYEASALS